MIRGNIDDLGLCRYNSMGAGGGVLDDIFRLLCQGHGGLHLHCASKFTITRGTSAALSEDYF